jgi:diacylglycerol kinase
MSDPISAGNNPLARPPVGLNEDAPAAAPSSRPGERPGNTLVHSFTCAFAGLWYAIRTQQNMRIHLSVAVAAIALGIYVQLNWTQWAVLALTIGAVMIAEMFNTVAEAALDAATPYYHPLVKIAKDVAAGAVLLTALIAVCVGLMVLGPPLWSKLVRWLGW